jgi:hypothetical protein
VSQIKTLNMQQEMETMLCAAAGTAGHYRWLEAFTA